ncbi:MAG TPA: autotransporter outer membrane beta-barrel domain-containing protein, partial [Xanthobacteraceae bacterium]
MGALLFAAALTSPAAAQGGCTFFLPCPPVPASNGSVFESAQASLFDIGSHFQNRLGALSSSRTAASRGNNPQGGGADLAVDPVTYERYRTWFEGYGINTTTDAQGTFVGDRRKMYGGLAGAGMTVTPGVTFGLSVDRNTTDADLPGASGRIDMTQIGALGSFEKGPWTLGVTVIHGFGDVNSSRFDGGGTSTAAYHARLWGTMAELS